MIRVPKWYFPLIFPTHILLMFLLYNLIAYNWVFSKGLRCRLHLYNPFYILLAEIPGVARDSRKVKEIE
jgi:hypothetical protein